MLLVLVLTLAPLSLFCILNKFLLPYRFFIKWKYGIDEQQQQMMSSLKSA